VGEGGFWGGGVCVQLQQQPVENAIGHLQQKQQQQKQQKPEQSSKSNSSAGH